MTAEPSIIVGVDNGLDGGLVAIAAFDGSIIDAMPMPTRLMNGKREVDPHAVSGFLYGLARHPSRLLFAIEEPLKHAKSSQAMRSMGISFGQLSAIAETIGCATMRVQVLDWQKAVLGKVARHQTKTRALAVATTLWPDQCWLASKRCKVPHDGMVDAALLARYARMKTFNTPL